MPIGITAGGKDGLVPPGSVVRLAGVLKNLQPDVLLIYRDATGHSTSYQDGKTVLEFVIDRVIRSPTRLPKALGLSRNVNCTIGERVVG